MAKEKVSADKRLLEIPSEDTGRELLRRLEAIGPQGMKTVKDLTSLFKPKEKSVAALMFGIGFESSYSRNGFTEITGRIPDPEEFNKSFQVLVDRVWRSYGKAIEYFIGELDGMEKFSVMDAMRSVLGNIKFISENDIPSVSLVAGFYTGIVCRKLKEAEEENGQD